MRIHRAVGVLALGLLAACGSAGGDDPTGESQDELTGHSAVNVWVTSDPRDAFKKGAATKLGAPSAEPGSAGVIDVADSNELLRQKVEGFGAALTDASAAIMHYELDDQQRSQLIDELMSESNGLGLNVLRLPIAASDSTWKDAYSYDDGSADPSLARFSVKHDEEYILPILEDIVKHVNRDVRIIASPWSPPAWMKQGTGSMIGGSLRSEYRAAYADYIVKFVRAYWEHGVAINAITPQNEPGQPANYPSMTLLPSAEAELVTGFIAPALDKAKFGWVNILGFDHNWGDAYPSDLLANDAARKVLGGIAFHCYGGDHSAAMGELHDKFQKDVYLTECDRSETPSGQNAGHDEGIQKLIRAMNNWSRTYVAWQLVLHPDGTPNKGSGCRHEDAQGNVVWHCVGVVSVDPKKHSVEKEWDYAYLGHASKFVRRDARAVHVAALGPVESVAFVNPDGSRILVAYNSSEATEKFQVRWHGQSFNAEIPKRSAATFKW